MADHVTRSSGPILILFLLLLTQETSGLHIRSLEVPEVAQVGHDAVLFCDFSLDMGQRLYQVKWYKGSHEFYRFSPSAKVGERVKLFLVENLRVDVRRSDATHVVLRNLHVDMSGKYTCEVSTEADFETVQAEAHMLVVALPRGGPNIHVEVDNGGGEELVHEVRVLRANCSSPRSKPAAKLAFFVNGRRMAGSKKEVVSMREYVVVNEQEWPQVETSILAMELLVKRHHVVRGRIHIRCEASIRQVYRNSKSTNVYIRTQTANLNHERRESVEEPTANSERPMGLISMANQPFVTLAIINILLA